MNKVELDLAAENAGMCKADAKVDAFESIWFPLNEALQEVVRIELCPNHQHLSANLVDIIERLAGDIADEHINNPPEPDYGALDWR